VPLNNQYRGRKGQTKAFAWTEYRDLLTAARHQLPGGNIVLIWDNLNVHLRAELRACTAAQPWLRVFQLPSCAPDLNPVEGIWSSLKRGPLANLAVTSYAHLLQVIRHGLKKTQHQPGLIEGCLAGTGLSLEADGGPTSRIEGQYVAECGDEYLDFRGFKRRGARCLPWPAGGG